MNVCRTLSCALNGAERVTEELCGKLGIKPGETDASGTFTLMEVECLGACDRAPVVMVNDAWHECLTPENGVEADRRSARARRSGARRAVFTWSKNEGLRGLRAHGYRTRPTRYVLREPNAFTLDFYLQHEGYGGPEDRAREDAGRDHRAGDGRRPARPRRRRVPHRAEAWKFVDKKVEPRYIVCNADESEPGTFKIHLLMERNPAPADRRVRDRLLRHRREGRLHLHPAASSSTCRPSRARDRPSRTLRGSSARTFVLASGIGLGNRSQAYTTVHAGLAFHPHHDRARRRFRADLGPALQRPRPEANPRRRNRRRTNAACRRSATRASASRSSSTSSR